MVNVLGVVPFGLQICQKLIYYGSIVYQVVVVAMCSFLMRSCAVLNHRVDL